jgi:transcriptional regulator GlxA family with amidase domain
LGRTPGQELSRLKIERVRTLLATTSLPLKQIAMHCGYANVSRMGEAFRHAAGQTPIEYRRGFSPH